jgi:hypothetical protein
MLRAGLHIRKFEDASTSPCGDPASLGETRQLHSVDAIIDHCRCIISLKDAHSPQEMPHLSLEMWYLLREMWVHLQILASVTLLKPSYR